MATEMLPERCVNHMISESDILCRINVLEKDIKELYVQLKGKVDIVTIKEMMDRNTKEIEELKDAVLRLNAADTKHSEALAGIHQVLKGFKENQDLMRQDYSKLAECYTQTSIHIASITTILAERAKKEDSDIPKIEVSTSNDPWYVRMVHKSKALTYTVIAFVATIMWILVSNITEIITLLQSIFGK